MVAWIGTASHINPGMEVREESSVAWRSLTGALVGWIRQSSVTRGRAVDLESAERLRVFEGRGHVTVARHPEWSREIERFIAEGDRPA